MNLEGQIGRNKDEVYRSDARASGSASERGREHARLDTNEREREWGPQLPSFCQGWAGVFVYDSDLGQQSRLHREESKDGEKVNKKSKVVLPATDHVALYLKK